MNKQELARWLREEHDKAREISDRVLERVASIPMANQHKWIQDVREVFDHLRAHLIKHMALEERDGYMLSVVNRRPALGREVDRLAHEHGELAARGRSPSGTGGWVITRRPASESSDSSADRSPVPGE